MLIFLAIFLFFLLDDRLSNISIPTNGYFEEDLNYKKIISVTGVSPFSIFFIFYGNKNVTTLP